MLVPYHQTVTFPIPRSRSLGSMPKAQTELLVYPLFDVICKNERLTPEVHETFEGTEENIEYTYLMVGGVRMRCTEVMQSFFGEGSLPNYKISLLIKSGLVFLNQHNKWMMLAEKDSLLVDLQRATDENTIQSIILAVQNDLHTGIERRAFRQREALDVIELNCELINLIVKADKTEANEVVVQLINRSRELPLKNRIGLFGRAYGKFRDHLDLDHLDFLLPYYKAYTALEFIESPGQESNADYTIQALVKMSKELPLELRNVLYRYACKKFSIFASPSVLQKIVIFNKEA